MLARELYNMQDAYKCKNNEDAMELFRALRNKMGDDICYEAKYNPNITSRLISGRQFAVSEMAVRYIKEGNLKEAIRETYDFLHNYGDDDHELTNPEYAVLNIILMFVEMGVQDVSMQ